jgi:hypothetical protein
MALFGIYIDCKVRMKTENHEHFENSTLREKHGMRMFETRRLRKVSGTRKQGTGGQCITRNFIICTSWKVLFK